ncbi:hypothetical protein OS493_040590, partial [Desmophyllum pertusum]
LYWFVPSSHKIKPSEKVPHKIYQVPYQPGWLENDLVRREIEGDKLQYIMMMSEVQTVICESFLNSADVLKELKDFDLIVYDSLAVCPATLFGERHNIPRVESIPLPPNAPFAFNHMIPMPVSYVPQLFTGLSDKMTFLERVVNLGAYLGSRFIMNIAKTDQ